MRVFLLFYLIIFGINLAFATDFNNVKYLSNYDGDTIRFDLCGDYPYLFRFMPMRLYGIDTPEIKTHDKAEKRAALKAKNFVKKELSNAKVINLKNCKKDKFFRLLCCVEYDKKDLTQELLKRNYGYAYYGKRKQKIKNYKKPRNK